jgi:hypothetical protein
LEATHPAAAPASRLLMPSSLSRILRNAHLTKRRVSTVEHMKMVIVRYWRFKLSFNLDEFFSNILRDFTNCRTPEMTSPYFRFLRVIFKADMMHPCS